MPSQVATPVFRVDKFAVPAAALSAFLARVKWVDRVLAEMPGCRQNLVLTQAGEASSEFNVTTIVEWESAEAMSAAKARVRWRYAEEGFDPAAFMRRVGVRADLGEYGPA
ncbi:MAG TPA: antibiotic biosynthesis monooxygenase [Variovorax sp.]|nr:antibiotic biosynthesis monooxygenase [Variovorax sp.]